MSTSTAEPQPSAPVAFRLSEQEAAELERACVEADEEEEAGTLTPLAGVLAELRKP